MSALDITLQSVTYTNISILSQIAADSFLTDRHTQVKQLGRHPYDMSAVMKSDLVQSLASERCLYMKAVDRNTGQILGYCGWGFRLDDYGVISRSDPGTPPNESIVRHGGVDEEESSEEKDIIDELCDLEDADMKHWVQILMPEGTQCMYIRGLYVKPEVHRKNVGTTLMNWGLEVADQLGLFTWVHSSEGASRFYTKHGFEVIGELDIDLDAWAPRSSPLEDGGKWGHYVLRYMKRPTK
jgi:GNAT superfamily N-acetyltransferase